MMLMNDIQLRFIDNYLVLVGSSNTAVIYRNTVACLQNFIHFIPKGPTSDFI